MAGVGLSMILAESGCAMAHCAASLSSRHLKLFRQETQPDWGDSKSFGRETHMASLQAMVRMFMYVPDECAGCCLCPEMGTGCCRSCKQLLKFYDSPGPWRLTQHFCCAPVKRKERKQTSDNPGEGCAPVAHPPMPMCPFFSLGEVCAPRSRTAG